MKPFDHDVEPTIPAVLDAFAERLPDRVAVSTDDRDITASELARLSRQMGASLRELGLVPGEAVGVLLPNGWRWMVAVLGAAHAGLVAVPLNTWYKESELADATSRAGISVVISQRRVLGRDFEGLSKSAGLLDRKGAFRGTLFWETGDLPEGLPAAAALDRGLASPHDPALYVFTSGSSATPKVVVLTHGNLLANGNAMGERQHLGDAESIWLTSPLFFGYGCANAVPVALTHGATLCIQERFDPTTSAKFAAERSCTVFYGLGPTIRALVGAEAAAHYDLSSLRTGPVGLSPEEKRLAVQELGIEQACSVYGLTECYGLGVMTEPGDSLETVMGTVGRPLPNHELRIVDPMSSELIEPGDGTRLGEIQLRGCITPGYLNNPEANSQAFADDGWYRTGDLGWIDLESRLHYAGRIKEVVKVNGITISPAEVETYIGEHPAVDQAYVFGWPGPDGSEMLACGLVVKDDVDSGFADELRMWLRERVSSYKVPRTFVFLDSHEVPLTPTGKVNKRLIGELHVEDKAVAGD